MQQYKDYFFSHIDRSEGHPAPDWKAVLESLVTSQGFGKNPQPGEVQPADAKHHGMTVMIDAGGNARGRIWLPADSPVIADGNAWFTHEIQVIADGQYGDMVWAWIDKGGAPVRPFTGQSSPTPGPTPVPPLEWEAITTLERKVADLTRRLDGMTTGGLPKRIALKDWRGKYLCSDLDRGEGSSVPILANRVGRGTWETFDLEAIE